MEERKKFHNEMDKSNYMAKMFHEYIDKYFKVNEKQPLNKMNVELIQEINEYYNKIHIFQRITKVIWVFIKEVDVIENEFSCKLLNIKKSCMKQKELMGYCKKILKTLPVERKYYNAIKYEINKMSKRIDYLLEFVIPTYIELTPLSNYIKDMGKENFYEEILEEFSVDEKMEDEDLQKYIQKIVSSYSDDENWKAGMEKYKRFLQEKYKKIEDAKQKEALEKKKKLAEEAERKLILTSNNLQKLYFDGEITYGHNYKVSKLGSAVADLNKEEKANRKIVFLAKTARGFNASVFYYSSEVEGFLTQSFRKCSIIKEYEKLPEELQTKIDSYELVAVEMMV